MNWPLISIITPSFNQGKYLEQTILSIHQQNYPHYEHIIIDGDSTDNSVEIIKKYSHKLKYWISEKDNGQTHAINKGIKQCTGQIITWINSDDILDPGALEFVAEFFNLNPKATLIHGKSILFGEGIQSQIIGEIKNNMQHRYLAYIPYPQPSSFFRRNIIDATGYLDEKLHFGMDYELLMRATLNGEVKYCDKILSRYRLHKKSKSNLQLKFAKEWNQIFSKFLNSLPFTDEYINILKKIDLFQKQDEQFIIHKKISRKDVEYAVLYHLLIQFHYHYNANDFSMSLRIIKAIKKLSPQFYRNERLQQQYLKVKYLPSLIIQGLRIIKRKKLF